MPRRVRIHRLAEADLHRIAENIRIRVSSASARHWSALLRAAIDALGDSAEMYPQAEEARISGQDLRVRLAGRRPHIYRILFTFDNQMAHVHRDRHAAQDNLSAEDL